jgi:hypothetical protein
MAKSLQFLEVRERFLPVKLSMLRDRMLSDPRLSGEEREQLGRLFDMMADRFHVDFGDKLEHLKTVYDRFDPDRDTLPLSYDVARESAEQEELSRAFAQLLLDANYVEMPREQIMTCVQYQSQIGLSVRASLADYAQLRVFYRGMRHEQRTFRPWYAPWKQKDERVHVLSRVALLIRLTKHPHGPIFLKLFKNVVVEDLEMLMPYVQVHMRLIDHLKIGSSVAGGVLTAFWKVFTAAILSPWIFLFVMCGFAGAFIRGVSSFVSNKTRYMQTLTANLYFQNLANNGSAITHLVDAAEAEECKELSLVYFILYVERDRDYAPKHLDRRIEEWLRTEFGLKVNFEVSDAVQKLRDKGLLIHRPSTTASPSADGLLKVHDLPATLRLLDETWDNYHACNNP